MELAFALVNRGPLHVSLSLHTAEPVPQPEWDTVIAHLERLGAGGQLRPELARMLVITDGGAPDARQRAQLNDAWGGQPIRVAVVIPGLNNPVKRGVMTALTWVNPAIDFFVAAEMKDALVYLGLDGQLASLWPELRALQQRIPTLQTLRAIAANHDLPW